MSGVRTGSRLEQLEALRARLDHEIAVERRRAILAGELKPAAPAPGRGSSHRTQARLNELGVTTRQVKEWAVRSGLIPAVVRGRVSLELVEQYAARPRLEL